MDDNITRPVFGDARVVVDLRAKPVCRHYYVMIRGRVVVCRSCREPVDPVEVLEDLSRDWNWATHWSHEIEKHEKRVAELKAEEANIKARIRTAYRGTGEPRSVLFYEELVRRLNAVETSQDLWETRFWAQKFPWLDTKMQAVVKEAEERAEKRAKRSAKKRRPRHISVVKGGK